MKPHKWAKEIKAWADGAEIEMREDDGTWGLVVNPLWHNFNEYRIKPQPKEPQYLYAYKGELSKSPIFVFDKNDIFLDYQHNYIGKIKLECDDE